MPPGRAERREAASSVAPVSQSIERALRPLAPRLDGLLNGHSERHRPIGEAAHAVVDAPAGRGLNGDQTKNLRLEITLFEHAQRGIGDDAVEDAREPGDRASREGELADRDTAGI
jgi:hypothetical protein